MKFRTLGSVTQKKQTTVIMKENTTQVQPKRRVSFASQQHTYLYDTEKQLHKKKEASPLKPKPTNRTPPRRKHVEQGSPMVISPNNDSLTYDTDESFNTSATLNSSFENRVDGVEDLMDVLAERTKNDKRLSTISMYSDEDMQFTSTTGKFYSIVDDEEYDQHNATQHLDQRMSMGTMHGNILFAADVDDDDEETRHLNAVDNRMSMGTTHGNILFVAREDENAVSQDQTVDLGIRIGNLQADPSRMSLIADQFDPNQHLPPKDFTHRFHNASIMELTNATGRIFSTHESVLEEQTREILSNIQRLSTVDPNVSITNQSLLSLASPAVIPQTNRSVIVDGSFRISPPKGGVFDEEEDIEHAYQESLIYDDDETFGNNDEASIANYTFEEFLSQFQIPLFHDNVTNRRMTIIHRNEGKIPETRNDILQLLCVTTVEKEAIEKMKIDLTSQIEVLSQKVRNLESNFEQNNPPICTLAQHIPEQSAKERRFKHQLSILRTICKIKAELKLIDWKIEMKQRVYDEVLNHSNKLANGDVKKLEKYLDHVKSLINELEMTLQQEKTQQQQQLQLSQPTSSQVSQDITSPPISRPIEPPKQQQTKKQTQMNHYSVLRSVGGNWEPLVINDSQLNLRYKFKQELGCDFLLSIGMNSDQISAINFTTGDPKPVSHDRHLQIKNALIGHYLRELKQTCSSHMHCNINAIPSLTKAIALNFSRIQSICEELQEISARFSSSMYIATTQPSAETNGVSLSFIFSSLKFGKRFTLTMLLSSQYPYEQNLTHFQNDLGPTTEQQVRSILDQIPVNRFGRLVRIASSLTALLNQH